jgi:hypothetical protein
MSTEPRSTVKLAYELSHQYSVTQNALFNAFIDAATLQNIWGVSTIKVDPRPGGQARATLTFAGENWDFTITYKEVVPYDKLRWVVHFDRFPNKETRATLWFKQTIGGSEVTVQMENFETPEERDSNKHAWERALQKLETL